MAVFQFGNRKPVAKLPVPGGPQTLRDRLQPPTGPLTSTMPHRFGQPVNGPILQNAGGTPPAPALPTDTFPDNTGRAPLAPQYGLRQMRPVELNSNKRFQGATGTPQATDVPPSPTLGGVRPPLSPYSDSFTHEQRLNGLGGLSDKLAEIQATPDAGLRPNFLEPHRTLRGADAAIANMHAQNQAAALLNNRNAQQFAGMGQHDALRQQQEATYNRGMGIGQQPLTGSAATAESMFPQYGPNNRYVGRVAPDPIRDLSGQNGLSFEGTLDQPGRAYISHNGGGIDTSQFVEGRNTPNGTRVMRNPITGGMMLVGKSISGVTPGQPATPQDVASFAQQAGQNEDARIAERHDAERKQFGMTRAQLQSRDSRDQNLMTNMKRFGLSPQLPQFVDAAKRIKAGYTLPTPLPPDPFGMTGNTVVGTGGQSGNQGNGVPPSPAAATESNPPNMGDVGTAAAIAGGTVLGAQYLLPAAVSRATSNVAATGKGMRPFVGSPTFPQPYVNPFANTNMAGRPPSVATPPPTAAQPTTAPRVNPMAGMGSSPPPPTPAPTNPFANTNMGGRQLPPLNPVPTPVAPQPAPVASAPAVPAAPQPTPAAEPVTPTTARPSLRSVVTQGGTPYGQARGVTPSAIPSAEPYQPQPPITLNPEAARGLDAAQGIPPRGAGEPTATPRLPAANATAAAQPALTQTVPGAPAVQVPAVTTPDASPKAPPSVNQQIDELVRLANTQEGNGMKVTAGETRAKIKALLGGQAAQQAPVVNPAAPVAPVQAATPRLPQPSSIVQSLDDEIARLPPDDPRIPRLQELKAKADVGASAIPPRGDVIPPPTQEMINAARTDVVAKAQASGERLTPNQINERVQSEAMARSARANSVELPTERGPISRDVAAANGLRADAPTRDALREMYNKPGATAAEQKQAVEMYLAEKYPDGNVTAQRRGHAERALSGQTKAARNPGDTARPRLPRGGTTKLKAMMPGGASLPLLAAQMAFPYLAPELPQQNNATPNGYVPQLMGNAERVGREIYKTLGGQSGLPMTPKELNIYKYQKLGQETTGMHPDDRNAYNMILRSPLIGMQGGLSAMDESRLNDILKQYAPLRRPLMPGLPAGMNPGF